MLPQEPEISLASSELRTVNTALLACSNANHLSIQCITNRIGLRVLQRDCSKHQITLSVGGQDSCLQ